MTIVKPKPLAEYKTPWEAKGEEYDPEKGKTFIHYLATQAWEQQEAAKKAESDLTTVTSERDKFKAKVDSAQRANETEVEKLTRERDEALAKASDADKPDPEKLKLEVALDKGLSKTMMKRLVGSTLEELTADADALLEEFGPGKKDGEEGGEGSNDPGTQPKSKLKNPGDPRPTEGRFDAEKAADDYLSNNLSI